MVLVEPSASEAEAVRPTREPAVLFSATVFAALLLSAGAETLNSLTSVMASETACSEVLPAASVATTVKAYVDLISKFGLLLRVTAPVALLMLKDVASPLPGLRLYVMAAASVLPAV